MSSLVSGIVSLPELSPHMIDDRFLFSNLTIRFMQIGLMPINLSLRSFCVLVWRIEMRFWFAVFLVLMFVGTAMAGHRRGFEGEKDPTERSNQLLDRKRAIYRSYSKNFNRLQKLRPEMFGEEYYKKKYDEPPPFLPDFVPLKDQSKEAYEKGPRESSSVLSQFKESDFNGPQALMLVDILEAELLKLKHQLKKQTRQSRKSIKKPKRKKIPAAENVYGDV